MEEMKHLFRQIPAIGPFQEQRSLAAKKLLDLVEHYLLQQVSVPVPTFAVFP
jgi:hypothetical protein